MSVAINPVESARVDLADLPFLELYICLDDPNVISRWKPDITRIKEIKSTSVNLPVSGHFDEEINEIREALRELIGVRELGVIMHSDLRLRYTISHAADNEIWADLRPIPLIVPTPEELMLGRSFVDLIMHSATKKGIILIGGEPGQGKTTTSVSFLKNICMAYGGTLFTIEDPREYMLSGALSETSWCIQHDIMDDGDWEKFSKIAKRFNPDYLFFGEIRTREAAEQLISASARGNLVMATIHSSNAADTVSSLMSYLKPENRESAKEIIANRLLVSTCQTMTPKGPLVQTIAITKDANDVAKSAIIEGNYGNLLKSAKRHPPR